MKNNKLIALVLALGFFLTVMGSSAQTITITGPTSYVGGQSIQLVFAGLTKGAHYIWVTDSDGGAQNITFTAASSTYRLVRSYPPDSDDSFVGNLYVYNITTGASTGSILASFLFNEAEVGDFTQEDLFIEALPGLFILGIAAVIVGGILLRSRG